MSISTVKAIDKKPKKRTFNAHLPLCTVRRIETESNITAVNLQKMVAFG